MPTRKSDLPAPAAATRPTATLPTSRPSRVIVEAVRPAVDGGRFPAKAACGRPVTVLADLFTDGHDVVTAEMRWRTIGGDKRTSWRAVPMEPIGNDRFEASFVPDQLGRHEYNVRGWVDHAETWRRDTVKKIDAGLDVTSELQSGAQLIDTVLAAGPKTATADDRRALGRLLTELRHGDTSSLDDPTWTTVFHRSGKREPIAEFSRPMLLDVDPLRATFSSWYEFFPRSAVGTDEPPATLADALGRLDYVADMGFDVVYLPPIHPIGFTKRKGRNNVTVADDIDVGSPWAIGSHEGGHLAVAPDLGTVEDVANLAAACRERDMELAIDIAFNCSPDHPWVADHPEWFKKRPDGSIQFSENPPKKYEDIFPLDFESDDWRSLWSALADVFRFWIDHGVRTFRVDNPHTKAFAFWEWAIGEIRTDHPDVIFLAEAFTRPRVMERLAKIGFNQSYTYFTWRQSSWELHEYFDDLATRTIDYFRPNAWPNTPDILTEQLQQGGRPAFVSRAILAATLSPSWGVYGPAFELLEHEAIREGSEEYLDSEKYQLRHWDLDRDDSLAPLLTRLNEIRRAYPAFMSLETLQFHPCDDPGLLCFSKRDVTGETDPVLVVVNLDPHDRHAGLVDVDLHAIGLEYGSAYHVTDRLGGASYRWEGNTNFVDLAPWGASAHIFTVSEVEAS